MQLKNKKIRMLSILALSMIILTGIFRANVSALENNELEVNQLSSEDLEKIESKYGGDIKYQENKNLTDEEISKRFDIIDSIYGIEEPFSDKDAEFIVNYAESKPNAHVRVTTKAGSTFTLYAWG